MGNPNTQTTPKHKKSDNVIKVETLQRNQQDQAQTLEYFLSCVRNPEKKLGKRVFLNGSKHYAKDMRTLEQVGYERNSKEQCFDLPQQSMKCPFKEAPSPRVQLKDDDTQFIEKMNWLEKNGYTRNKDENCFELDAKALKSFKRKESAAKVLNITKTTTAVAFLIVGGLAGIFIKGL